MGVPHDMKDVDKLMRTVAPWEVERTLKERGEKYGEYSDNAEVHMALLQILQSRPGWRDRLTNVHQSALDVICQKMARIVNGDPNYTDNWHDIQGYAKLAEDRCK